MWSSSARRNEAEEPRVPILTEIRACVTCHGADGFAWRARPVVRHAVYAGLSAAAAGLGLLVGTLQRHFVSKNVLTPWHLTLLGVGMASVATLCVGRPAHAQARESIHATARVEEVTIPMRALRAAEAEITRLLAIVATRVQTDSLAADVLVLPRAVHPAVRVAVGGLVTIARECGTPRRPDEPRVPQCTAVRIVVTYVANE